MRLPTILIRMLRVRMKSYSNRMLRISLRKETWKLRDENKCKALLLG